MFERSRPLIGGLGFLSFLSFPCDTSGEKTKQGKSASLARNSEDSRAVSIEEEEEVIMLYEWADNHSHQPRRGGRLPLHVLPRR